MTKKIKTSKLLKKMLHCNNRREMKRLLNKHRIPVNQSKYC